MREQEEGHAMPLAAPSFAPPPLYATPETKAILMAFKADPEAVAWEVPEPLEMADDGLMMAFMGDMVQPAHSMDVYHECTLGIKVRYKEWSGWYTNYLWVEHDIALILCRELYGWPANLCEPTRLQLHGSQIIADCVRNGESLMRLSMNVTSVPPAGRSDPLEEEFGRLIGGDWLQLRKFPSPEKEGAPIKQLFRMPPTDFKVHEIWSGPATLELGQSGLYPHLHKLNPTEVLGAWYTRCEWVVPHAEMIWENR